jgi:hypothetical protein
MVLVGPVTVKYSMQITSAYDKIDMQTQRYLPSPIIYWFSKETGWLAFEQVATTATVFHAPTTTN